VETLAVPRSGLLKIKKVIPAGSLAKNTILKGHPEVDCVYILEHNGYSFKNKDAYYGSTALLQKFASGLYRRLLTADGYCRVFQKTTTIHKRITVIHKVIYGLLTRLIIRKILPMILPKRRNR
jgi:hypothetical protein